MKKNKIYIVHWTDATALEKDGQAWFTADEAKELALKDFNNKNTDTGIIIEKNKQFLIIAGSRADDRYSNMTMIPIEMIVKIKELK